VLATVLWKERANMGGFDQNGVSELWINTGKIDSFNAHLMNNGLDELQTHQYSSMNH